MDQEVGGEGWKKSREKGGSLLSMDGLEDPRFYLCLELDRSFGDAVWKGRWSSPFPVPVHPPGSSASLPSTHPPSRNAFRPPLLVILLTGPFPLSSLVESTCRFYADEPTYLLVCRTHRVF